MPTQRIGPKQHHYVPQFYLRRFTDAEGYLYVRDAARDQIRRQKPQKVMRIDAYYRQSWAPAGIDPNVLENFLGSVTEGEAKAAIDCLIDTPERLRDVDACNIVSYLEIQRIRVPRQAEWGKELMRRAILNNAPPDIVAQINAGQFQLTMKDSARFDFMRMALGTIYPWLARMEWEVFEAEPGSSFITTDSPVSFYNPACLPPAEAGVGLAGTKVYFPLSPRKLLLMRYPERHILPPLTVLDDPPTEFDPVPITHGTIWPAAVVRRANRKLAVLSHELFVSDSLGSLSQCQ